MRVLDIVRGILTGYGFRVLQIAATLIVVPFLLRSDALGLDQYGRVVAILGLLAPITLVTDGLRLSFARSIARSLSEGGSATGREIGNAFKIVGGVNLGLATFLFVFRHSLIDLMGIPREPDYATGFAFAIVFIVLENLFTMVTAHVNARGSLDVANTILGVEVIARNLAFVGWYSWQGGSITPYLAIFAFGTACRFVALLVYAMRRWPEDFAGFWSGSLTTAGGAILYSVPISGVSLNFYVFERLSIPATARFIGPTEAGLLALGIQTVATNLSQIVFDAARPFLIPIASRIRLDRMTSSRRRLLSDVDAIYILIAGAYSCVIIGALPTLIELWLGTEKSALIFPAQLLVAGSGFHMAFNLRRALLVGQGFAKEVARKSFACGGMGLLGLVWFLFIQPSWWGVAFVVAAVNTSAAVVGIALPFERCALPSDDGTTSRGLRAAAVLGLGAMTAIVGSRFVTPGLTAYLLLPSVIGAAVIVVAGHFFVISGGETVRTLSILKAGYRIQIFDDSTDGSS